MKDSKTKMADQAKAALGVATPSPEYLTRDQWWIDTLKQQYNTVMEAGSKARYEKHQSKARLRDAQAAILADTLEIYCHQFGQAESAQLWADRANTLHRRAFAQTNRIAENIGASMS